ncbi:MAG TPA: thiamine phosphate synthase [Candidatus Methylomirabilis sp.]|nr:thiamine phosphate synthase [Candidatus Methylomirabilis sp.]
MDRSIAAVKAPFSLCVITDEQISGLRHREIAAQALEGGATMIQLRDKEGDLRSLYEEAVAIRQLCRRYGSLFIVNDRLDVALASEADGVHLGQEDLPPERARPLLHPGMLLGISTHSVEEARAAEAAGADYIGFGPVFPTATKTGTRPTVGVDGIRMVKAAVALPVLAIGGITLERVPEVVHAGADGLAVISAIVGSGRITALCRQFLSRIQERLAQERH